MLLSYKSRVKSFHLGNVLPSNSHHQYHDIFDGFRYLYWPFISHLFPCEWFFCIPNFTSLEAWQKKTPLLQILAVTVAPFVGLRLFLVASKRLQEVAPQLDARQVSLMFNAFVKVEDGGVLFVGSVEGGWHGGRKGEEKHMGMSWGCFFAWNLGLLGSQWSLEVTCWMGFDYILPRWLAGFHQASEGGQYFVAPHLGQNPAVTWRQCWWGSLWLVS